MTYFMRLYAKKKVQHKQQVFSHQKQMNMNKWNMFFFLLISHKIILAHKR
jgi:hypothetical protein